MSLSSVCSLAQTFILNVELYSQNLHGDITDVKDVKDTQHYPVLH